MRTHVCVGLASHSHPLRQTRLKGYFDKLQTAESSSSTSASTEAPPTSATRDGRTSLSTSARAHPVADQTSTRDTARFTIDKAAASRFINAAIASQKGKVDPFYTPPPPEHSTDANAEAGSSTGVHTRFDAAAAKLLESEDDESDENGEGMVVTRADESLDDEMLIVEKIRDGDDDEELIVEELPNKVEAEKIPAKGRPKMDPFAGELASRPAVSVGLTRCARRIRFPQVNATEGQRWEGRRKAIWGCAVQEAAKEVGVQESVGGCRRLRAITRSQSSILILQLNVVVKSANKRSIHYGSSSCLERRAGPSAYRILGCRGGDRWSAVALASTGCVAQRPPSILGLR